VEESTQGPLVGLVGAGVGTVVAVHLVSIAVSSALIFFCTAKLISSAVALLPVEQFADRPNYALIYRLQELNQIS